MYDNTCSLCCCECNDSVFVLCEWGAVDKRVGQQDDDRWNKRLGELKVYREENGDCVVPRGYNDNQKLGRWVNNQRAQYRLMKDGKKSQMTEERAQKLEEAGFVWKAKVGRRRRLSAA